MHFITGSCFFFGSILPLNIVMHGHMCALKRNLLLPCHQSSLGTRTYGSSDQWRRVPNVVKAFALDEIGHIGGEVLVVGLDIVLQNQAA